MRVVVAIPVGGLIAGCAAGLCWPGMPHWVLYALLIEFAFVAVLAFRETHGLLLVASVAAAFAAGGALLAAAAWQVAWRPTLRIAFESIARAERAEAAAHGHQLPLDDAATVALVGVLREDASPGEGGASLSVDVSGVTPIASRDVAGAADAGRVYDAVRGGAILTVNGALAFGRMQEWRGGRRIAATATLRRPSRYFDPGVADNERALARHGTTLVGTVKSGALVEVLARGSPRPRPPPRRAPSPGARSSARSDGGALAPPPSSPLS